MKYLIAVWKSALKMLLPLIPAYELGDKIKFEEAPAEFGRVAAQSAKQTIMEKCASKHVPSPCNTYKEHEQEIMSRYSGNALTTALSMSTLVASKPNCQNKTKFLEKFCFS